MFGRERKAGNHPEEAEPVSDAEGPPPGKVPLHALLISILAFSVTGVAAYVWPESLDTLSGFVWLLALIPSFLLAYHKGWQGAAAGLAGAMALMVGVQVVAVTILGNEVDWRLAGGLTVVLIVVSLGAGWFAEAFHQKQKTVIDLAYTDQLTGLANRRALLYSLSHHFAYAKRSGGALSVVLFDVDSFKAYNDRNGHQAGDEALSLVGHILWKNTRSSDTTGRYGGEEFLTVLPGEPSRSALNFAERVLQSISEAETTTGEHLTISAGIASYDGAMLVMRELIAAADVALYAAKAQGGNTIGGCPAQHRELDELRLADGRDTA